MKIKHQLSIATLVMAGVFATGCSQQSVMGEGASQVAGGQQVSGGQQVAGGEQMAGGQQVAGGQQAAGGQQVAGGQQGMDSQIPATVPVNNVPVTSTPVVAPKPMPKPVNKWCHSHAANSMTKSVSHCHKYNQRNHSHSYGQKVAPARPYVAPKVPTMAPKAPPVDVFALQTKLKAKGYYRGPIDGVVGSGTRAALQQFMQNQR